MISPPTGHGDDLGPSRFASLRSQPRTNSVYTRGAFSRKNTIILLRVFTQQSIAAPPEVKEEKREEEEEEEDDETGHTSPFHIQLPPRYSFLSKQNATACFCTHGRRENPVVGSFESPRTPHTPDSHRNFNTTNKLLRRGVNATPRSASTLFTIKARDFSIHPPEEIRVVKQPPLRREDTDHKYTHILCVIFLLIFLQS